MKHELRQHEFAFTRWGGKRRGAGRKPKGERAGVSHAKREALSRHHPVLVTMRIARGLPSLRERSVHEAIQRAFRASAKETFGVTQYSLQSNHLHVLVEARDKKSLTSGMTGLAVRIVKRLNELWKRRGEVFPDRYHARILKTPLAVRTALIYVLQNARKHGSLAALIPDMFSSAPLFDGWRGRTSWVADSSSSFTARARTWLLDRGWRKHGLIDLREIPRPG